MIQLNANAEKGIVSTREKQLNRYLNGAIQYKGKDDIFRVALCLQVINNEKLYAEMKYTNIYDFSKDKLGYARGTTSNYIIIAKRFLNSDTATSIFAIDGKDFNYRQLLEMKKLSVDDIKTLMSNGTLTFDTPSTAIKSIVADFKKKTKELEQQEKEVALQPLKQAYEDFHTAYNKLKDIVGDNDGAKEVMQQIMDSVVYLYNENDRLWN